MPLYAVDGCSIVTSDGIGSLKHGYDNIHKKLAEHGATQCGYCTPGFAMAMYRFQLEVYLMIKVFHLI